MDARVSRWEKMSSSQDSSVLRVLAPSCPHGPVQPQLASAPEVVRGSPVLDPTPSGALCLHKRQFWAAHHALVSQRPTTSQSGEQTTGLCLLGCVGDSGAESNPGHENVFHVWSGRGKRCVGGGGEDRRHRPQHFFEKKKDTKTGGHQTDMDRISGQPLLQDSALEVAADLSLSMVTDGVIRFEP